MRRKLKIKTGDIVKVIAGNQKGIQGKVLRVFANKNRAIVEGVNTKRLSVNDDQTYELIQEKINSSTIFVIFIKK